MAKEKYLVLDFGKVLAYPTTGHWFITPYIMDIAKEKSIDIDKLKKAMESYSPILSRKVVNLDEEESMFFDYYKDALDKTNQDLDNETILSMAKDTTHNNNKYGMYDSVKDELSKLAENYKILMLSDNWPCSFRIMKDWDIEKYFDKLYVSSVYGVTKRDKVLFDYLIDDYNIKEGEAIFVDDSEELLDIAKEKGFEVRLMNRDKEEMKSNYKIITNLMEI